MAILEKITANLELTQVKKFKLQKSILGLMLEWKHLEEYMDMTHQSFQECLDQLEKKEKHLDLVQKSVMESNKELESVRVSIEGRMKELGDKEREFDEQVKDLGLKARRLETVEKLIKERNREVELREEKLKGFIEEFRVEEKRFEGVRESIRERIDDINLREVRLKDKEKEFNLFRDEQVKELDLEKKRLGLTEKSVDLRLEQVELREEQVKVMLEEFKSEVMRFEEVRELVGNKSEEINRKQVELDKRSQELDGAHDRIERREKELDVKEEEFQRRLIMLRKDFEARVEQVEFRAKELDAKEDDYEKHLKEINLKQMELDKRSQELDVVQDKIERREKELDAKEEEFQKRVEQVEFREEKVKVTFEEIKVEEKRLEEIKEAVGRKYDEIKLKEMEMDKRSQELDGICDTNESRAKELDAKEDDFEKPLKELESKEEELSDRVSEIGSTGKQISNVDPTMDETKLEVEDIPEISPTDIEFWDMMDGKGLQLYLNQRANDHKSMAREVYQVLQLSPDPAKLVLDAIVGFYQTGPNNNEFELDVIRRSCILLLEQLLRLKPRLSPQVEVEAMELVCQWKTKLSKAPDSMEVLGHLYLLASYCLPMPYNTAEILRLVEIVAEHEQAPELCRLLGFTDKIPDLINNLVVKNRHLVAVKFVSEFGLVSKFPPANLLNEYLKHIRKSSMQMRKQKKSCLVHQNEVTAKRVTALREVISCIKVHKLESVYSPTSIEQTIEQLLMNKRNENGACREWRKSKNLPSVVPSSSIPGPTQLGPVTDMAFVLANMNGMSLQFFLNKHFKDHNLLRNEVLLALHHSVCPERLVLEAMEGFHLQNGRVISEHFEASVIRSSCLLLLEQLIRLQRQYQTQVTPQLKGEAMGIARYWKTKMKEEIKNPLVIMGFLQFIGAFGLTSRFDNTEIRALVVKIAPHPFAHELCIALGFSPKKLGIALNHLSRPSLENTPLSSTWLGVKIEGKGEVSLCHHASDPAKLVLDAIQSCYHSNFEKGSDISKSMIMDKFYTLLEQLAEVSPRIKIRNSVKEEAMAFSVDWKSKLSVSRRNQAEVKAFLHLLAKYKLDSPVMLEVLHGFLEPVYEYTQKIELYRFLNFTHKTPDYIQYLIEKDERLVAIEFIYEFDLFATFPPVPILESHLRYIEDFCKKLCEKGNCSPEALDIAADKEVALLSDVIGCMLIHNIEYDGTRETLEVRVDKLKKQKEDRKCSIPPTCELDTKKRAINLEAETQEQKATKRPRVMCPHAPASQNVVPSYPGGIPIRQQGTTPYSAWQYRHGGMAQLGWQYNIPSNSSAYHGFAQNVIPVQPTPPYLYNPWR